MTKKEIKNATNQELIYDALETWALFTSNFNTNRGTKQAWQHSMDLFDELAKRNLLTEEHLRILKM